MKTVAAASLFAAVAALALGPLDAHAAQTLGFDVSHYQPNVDWAAAVENGAKFVMIKSTESTNYISSSFNSQWVGATDAKLIRGAYHFAHPDSSSGADQAHYFLAHGGMWSADGHTLPGTLDIEYNPKKGSNTCYGLSPAAMVNWIKDFSDTYQKATKRYPTIYSTADWWETCTANSKDFASTNALFLAHPHTVGPIPGGWPTWTFWQFADSGKFPGDQDYFNGPESLLQKYASG